MSVRHPRTGFERQIQTLHNLLEFVSGIAAYRSPTFKPSFQLVSPIGVVGRYALNTTPTNSKIGVPKERVNIDSVLDNNYSEANWACKKMLDSKLHKHPDRFRALTVRLSQIATLRRGSYWNVF